MRIKIESNNLKLIDSGTIIPVRNNDNESKFTIKIENLTYNFIFEENKEISGFKRKTDGDGVSIVW